MNLLKADLLERFASIIEEDDSTEGFWLDVAKFYGVSEPTERQLNAARKVVRDVAAQLCKQADRNRGKP